MPIGTAEREPIDEDYRANTELKEGENPEVASLEEADDVIMVEADNQDLIDQNMMQYFDHPVPDHQVDAAKDQKLANLNTEGEKVCRICLGEEEDRVVNPLFSPCKCAGSMGLIHLECLREWLKSKKIQRVAETVSTFFWKNLECELCKEKLPIEFELRNKQTVLILDYDLPVYLPEDKPYFITLESISSNSSKVVHVINMLDQDEVSLGRGHDIEVRVTDISVSRCHAKIVKSPLGFFYIVDNNSKFGTLSLVRQPELINADCNNCFQIGKSLI